MNRFTIVDFIRESNRIENIHRDPTAAEIDAHHKLIGCRPVTIERLTEFVKVVQPDAVLRDRPGLNVRVGNHVPPPGGPDIVTELQSILNRMWMPGENSYTIHHAYETLHPYTDGNGRSGRALWLHMMGSAPLGFLHHWYYQSLQYGR